MELKAVLVCDDLRREVGNKLSAIGLYNESIVFPPGGPSALALPRLAVLFVVRGMLGVASYRYRHFLHYEPAGPLPDPPMQDGQRGPDNDEHNFVLQITPFIVPGPGRVRAVLEVDPGNDRRSRFEYAFEIRLADPGTIQ